MRWTSSVGGRGNLIKILKAHEWGGSECFLKYEIMRVGVAVINLNPVVGSPGRQSTDNNKINKGT